MNDKTYYGNIIKAVEQLAKSPTRQTFQVLSQVAVAQWRSNNEESYADWFESIYLRSDWGGGGWYCGAPPKLGIGRTNNALEILNRRIKRLVNVYDMQ